MTGLPPATKPSWTNRSGPEYSVSSLPCGNVRPRLSLAKTAPQRIPPQRIPPVSDLARKPISQDRSIEVEWRGRTSVLKEAKFSRKFGSSGHFAPDFTLNL